MQSSKTPIRGCALAIVFCLATGCSNNGAGGVSEGNGQSASAEVCKGYSTLADSGCEMAAFCELPDGAVWSGSDPKLFGTAICKIPTLCLTEAGGWTAWAWQDGVVPDP